MSKKITKTTNLDIFQPMKYRTLYYAISLLVLIPGILSLIKYGLKPSIDFTGGSNITWESTSLTTDSVAAFANSAEVVVVNVAKSGDTWRITTESIDQGKYQLFLSTAMVDHEIIEKEFSTVGPSLGEELINKTLSSIALAGLLILLYVTYRFRNIKFGATAIIAMLHDTFIVIGAFSLLGHFSGVEVDTLFVTAVLTILSFSVHDTIVVYDRIREIRKHHGYLDFEEVVNRAVVETLGRSINNSMTIIFMLLAMYLMGGDTTRWFIYALLIGTISGTYSSTFTAAPLLVTWDKFSSRKKKK